MRTVLFFFFFFFLHTHVRVPRPAVDPSHTHTAFVRGTEISRRGGFAGTPGAGRPRLRAAPAATDRQTDVRREGVLNIFSVKVYRPARDS